MIARSAGAMPMPVSAMATSISAVADAARADADLAGVGELGGVAEQAGERAVELAAVGAQTRRRRRRPATTIATGLPSISSRVIGSSSSMSSRRLDRLDAHARGRPERISAKLTSSSSRCCRRQALTRMRSMLSCSDAVAVGRQRRVDDVEVAEDGVQRRAELVRDGGEELILGVGGDARRVGLLGGVERAGGGVRRPSGRASARARDRARPASASRRSSAPYSCAVRAQREACAAALAGTAAGSRSAMRQRSPGQVPSTKRPMPRTNSRVAWVSENTLARSSRKRRCWFSSLRLAPPVPLALQLIDQRGVEHRDQEEERQPHPGLGGQRWRCRSPTASSRSTAAIRALPMAIWPSVSPMVIRKTVKK